MNELRTPCLEVDYDAENLAWDVRYRRKYHTHLQSAMLGKQTPMNPLKKALWIMQLTSGVYRQAYGTLVRSADGEETTRRCCLGVAADLCPTVVVKYENNQLRLKLPGERRGNSGILTKGLRQWLGISDEMQQLLARLNDGGVGFGPIAQFIDLVV